MEVNLRKANAISKAMIDAAKKLPLERTTMISVYDADSSPSDVVAMAGEKLIENARAAEALIAGAYVIREGIGRANASSGVDRLLTEKACLEAQEKILAAVVEPAGDHQYDAATNVEHAEPKLDTMRKVLNSETTRYGFEEELRIKVASPDVVEPLKTELATIRRRKSAIADELIGLNTTTKLRLPDEVVDLLGTHQLI